MVTWLLTHLRDIPQYLLNFIEIQQYLLNFCHVQDTGVGRGSGGREDLETSKL